MLTVLLTQDDDGLWDILWHTIKCHEEKDLMFLNLNMYSLRNSEKVRGWIPS